MFIYFQGGVQNVELLNAVSRDNYTMITYKRPLRASDIYDVSISPAPKVTQSVFWSIGYKSSEMRKIHKPQKNNDPLQINFGRRPKWNCPIDGQEKESSNEDQIEFDLSISHPTRSRPNKTPFQEGPKQRKPQLRKPPAPRDITLPPRKKIPRSRVGPNSQIDNWSDIFSPPTAPQPEVGGFKPEIPTKYSRRNQQTRTNDKPMRRPEKNPSSSNTPKPVYSLPDPLLDSKTASDVKMDYQPRTYNNNKRLNPNNKRNHAQDKASSSPWDVPSISCTDSRTKKKPLYIQLGPSAMHRGNQG